MPARLCVCILSLGAALLLPGCSAEETTEDVPRHARQLTTGTPVRLIKQESDLAHIETADSQRYYVDLGVLKTRSTATGNQEGSHTHILSAASAAYTDKPSVLPEPEPRTVEEISNEQLTLNRLYITEKTHRHIIAPTNKGLFVDEVTGENVWPACTCHNPDCPKRGTNENPYLFIFSDRSRLPICFACFEEFNLEGASYEVLGPYLRWTQPYELEEKTRRVKQLDAERKRAYKARKRKR